MRPRRMPREKVRARANVKVRQIVFAIASIATAAAVAKAASLSMNAESAGPPDTGQLAHSAAATDSQHPCQRVTKLGQCPRSSLRAQLRILPRFQEPQLGLFLVQLRLRPRTWTLLVCPLEQLSHRTRSMLFVFSRNACWP